MPDIDYKDLNLKLSFENWKLHNAVDSEDEWSEFDDEEKEEFDGDYENYLKQGYESYLEYNDFDD